METANRRNAAMAMSTLPRFAGGGLIEGFKKAIGIMPESPELKAYKERAAAERAGKTASPAAQTMAEPPKSAIGDYVGNSALDKRMKAAGLAKGGPVKGEGGPTDDMVPIMGSDGEYMIKAASAKIIGKPALDALNALADLPKNLGKPKAVPVGHFAAGGPIVDERQRLINQIPTGGNGRGPTPQPDASKSASGSDFGRNVSNTLSALPGAAPAFGAASRLAAVSPLVNTAASGVAGAAGGLASAAKPVLPYVPPVGGAAALMTGTASGQSPTAQPTAAPTASAAPTAPIPGGASPSMGSRNPESVSPDEAAATDGSVKVDRQANGNLAFSGKDISGTPQYTGGTAARMASTKGNLSVTPGMSRELIDRTLTNPDGSRWSESDNAIMAANIRDGVDPMRGTQRGMAAEKMAVLQGLALSPNGTPGKSNAVKILAMQSDERRTAATQQTERDKLALNAKGSELDNTGKQQVLDAQRAVTEAKTPAEKRSAMEVLAGLQGRMTQAPQDDYAYAPGGQEVDPSTGQLVTRPGVIFNKRTGAVGSPQQGQQPGQAELPPGMVKQIGTSNGKPVYLDKNGKQVIAKG